MTEPTDYARRWWERAPAPPTPKEVIPLRGRLNLVAPRETVADAFPNRGRRTVRDLAYATVPARATWVVAAMAVCLAVGLNAVTSVYPSTRLAVYAHTFEILPIWLLIGGSLHQVGARIVQAWDDWQAWRQS